MATEAWKQQAAEDAKDEVKEEVVCCEEAIVKAKAFAMRWAVAKAEKAAATTPAEAVMAYEKAGAEAEETYAKAIAERKACRAINSN